ncbi:MAG: DUF1992 domain-containing protein [Burkholderiales bacterium]|nr:MAG: DUF1992 domain-containing protein [Burkholderiales bacterium]
MLKALDDLVESRIRDAQARGEFDGLPGAGKPLPDEDLALVPPELRVALRILKNAGCVPAELGALRDLDAMIAQLARSGDGDGDGDGDGNGRGARAPAALDEAGRARGRRRLVALTMALEANGMGRSAAALFEYRDRIIERLGR